jgi:HEAT repeat protein
MSLLIVSALSAGGAALAQREGFIKVEGADLRARSEAAIRQARASSQPTPFWTAYAFDVRPGVAVDARLQDFRGTTNQISDTSISIGTSFGTAVETRNLAVFLLHSQDGAAITRLEIYNLDRPREYSGYPVYWLGRATNEESLSLLKGLAESNQPHRVAEQATMAIGLHDDRRVPELLKGLARSSSPERVRGAAIFWLGQIGGEQAFLSDIVRNEQESVEVRKKAAFAIGVSREATALSTLKGLYAATTAREVKKQIIFAASINQGKEEAVDFLIKVATTDADPEMKKQAIFWLGQKAGERSLEVLGDVVNSSDSDTEVQTQAVFAISRRPKDEAVPLLIKVARTHPKAEVRKQAIFWLGRTGDPRAIDFFREILSK